MTIKLVPCANAAVYEVVGAQRILLKGGGKNLTSGFGQVMDDALLINYGKAIREIEIFV